MPDTPPTDHHREMIEALARKLGLAFVSYLTHTSFATTEKNYGKQAPSAYWISIAEQVVRDYGAGRFGSGSITAPAQKRQ